MKKAIIIIMSLAIIFPIVPIFQTKTVSAETKIEQPFSKNKNRQAIFFAVAEKGGVTWNDGANNFHDALKQSDYLNYINADLPDGKKVNDEFEKVKDAFDKKPIKVAGKVGVGKIFLPLDAFLFSYGLTTVAMDVFQTAYDNHKAVKTLEDIKQKGASFDSIGSIYTVRHGTYPNSPSVATARIEVDGKDIGKSITRGYGYPVGTPHSYGFQLQGPIKMTDPRTGVVTYSYQVNSWSDEICSCDGRREVYERYQLGFIDVSRIDALTGGNVATVKEPKSLGTLDSPDWTKTPMTELPPTVEIEVPIDEDGYPDPERQLSPNNPAVNDPKKPLKTAPPDYESNPDEGQQTKPGPVLTPKPSPNTNPLPQPKPMPEKTPPKTDTIYPEGDGPETTPEDTKNRWGALITDKFPFSLPWDIGRMIEPLLADPKRPYVSVDKSFDVFGQSVPIKFSHNFKWMDDYIVFVRTFILISFNLFMIGATRRLMGGGQ